MRLSEDDLQRILSANPSLKLHSKSSKQKDNAFKQLTREDFDSNAEFNYYQRRVLSGVITGSISSLDIHKSFIVVDEVEHCGRKYKARQYTPDFVITYADGLVEVVEVKGKQVKKMQRDYPLRKQLFISRYCVPNHWRFIEVPAEEL